MQEALPDAGSTSYKDKLAVLARAIVLALVFQLKDLDMNPLLPLFFGTFNTLMYM